LVKFDKEILFRACYRVNAIQAAIISFFKSIKFLLTKSNFNFFK